MTEGACATVKVQIALRARTLPQSASPTPPPMGRLTISVQNQKPSSERKVALRSNDGRSLRNGKGTDCFKGSRSPSVSFADSSLHRWSFTMFVQTLLTYRRGRRPRLSALDQQYLYAQTQSLPPRGRWHTKCDGRSLRNGEVIYCFIGSHSPSVSFADSSLHRWSFTISAQTLLLHRRGRRPRRPASPTNDISMHKRYW